MKSVFTSIFIILFALLAGFPSFSQHEEETHQTQSAEEATESEEEFSKHQLGIMVGYAWVPQEIGDKNIDGTTTIPTIGLDYSYWIGEKYALKLVNDLEFSKYFVKTYEGNYIERENKIITALTFAYEPVLGVEFFAGPGIEYDSHHTYTVFKIGTELVKSFNDGWASGFSTSVDVNSDYYTISGGLVISKRF